MTVDEMIAKKKMYGFSYQYIAEKSGVPESTVQKVFSKTTPTPRMSTLTALSKMFEENTYSFASSIYSFKDKVPVGFWDGKCIVDFKEILEEISFML